MDQITELLDRVDTAFATLNIGQDHGITPQAAKACRNAWAEVNKTLYESKGRPEDARPDVILEKAFQDCFCK